MAAMPYQFAHGGKQRLVPIAGAGHAIEFQQQAQFRPLADGDADDLGGVRRVASQDTAAQHLAGAEPGAARDGGILPADAFIGKACRQHVGGMALAGRRPPVQHLQRRPGRSAALHRHQQQGKCKQARQARDLQTPFGLGHTYSSR
jgi:hypothetical protein